MKRRRTAGSDDERLAPVIALPLAQVLQPSNLYPVGYRSEKRSVPETVLRSTYFCDPDEPVVELTTADADGSVQVFAHLYADEVRMVAEWAVANGFWPA